MVYYTKSFKDNYSKCYFSAQALFMAQDSVILMKSHKASLEALACGFQTQQMQCPAAQAPNILPWNQVTN